MTHPLDEILDMLTGATEFAGKTIGEQPGMPVSMGFFVGMYLAHKHPEYAAALFPFVRQKVGPIDEVFSVMIDLWIERFPIDSN